MIYVYDHFYWNGLSLPIKDNVKPLNIPEVKSLALPNLSHFVNAIALVTVNIIAIQTKINEINWNLNNASTAKNIQITGDKYKNNQNTFESIGLMYLFGSAVSKTQILCPKSFDSFHHLNPTNNLPLIFLTFQKSLANNNIININRKIKLLINNNPIIYNTIGVILNPK